MWKTSKVKVLILGSIVLLSSLGSVGQNIEEEVIVGENVVVRQEVESKPVPLNSDATLAEVSTPETWRYSSSRRAAPPEEVLRTITYRLETPIDRNLLGPVEMILGPRGRIGVDSEGKILVITGPEESVDKALELIEQLSETYRVMMDEEELSDDPLSVQIEAVLLLGRGVAEPILSTTGSVLPYVIPQDIAHLGIGAEDLLPFSFGEVESMGRVILQSHIAPYSEESGEVSCDLGEHHLEFSFSNRTPKFPVLDIVAEYRPSMDSLRQTETDEGPSPDMAGAFGAVGGFGMGRSMEGQSPLGSARRGRVAGAPGGVGQSRGSHEVFSPRPTGMTSEARAVFNRPILVGGYKPTPDETAILAIRLKELKD